MCWSTLVRSDCPLFAGSSPQKNRPEGEFMDRISDLSDQELHARTLVAASKEKAATLALLDYLAEVDIRRLYSAQAYSSLWEYVHKALGYSESQASERVAAMRLMRRLPEI